MMEKEKNMKDERAMCTHLRIFGGNVESVKEQTVSSIKELTPHRLYVSVRLGWGCCSTS